MPEALQFPSALRGQGDSGHLQVICKPNMPSAATVQSVISDSAKRLEFYWTSGTPCNPLWQPCCFPWGLYVQHIKCPFMCPATPPWVGRWQWMVWQEAHVSCVLSAGGVRKALGLLQSHARCSPRQHAAAIMLHDSKAINWVGKVGQEEGSWFLDRGSHL